MPTMAARDPIAGPTPNTWDDERMAAITRSWSQGVALRPDDAITVVAQWISQCPATITSRDAYSLTAKAGSRVTMRLKGGWMANLDEMPCRIAVRASPWGPAHAVVVVEVQDDFGFGSRFGARQKFEDALDKWISTAFYPLQPHLV